VKEAGGYAQHKCIIDALKAAALEWEFEQLGPVER